MIVDANLQRVFEERGLPKYPDKFALYQLRGEILDTVISLLATIHRHLPERPYRYRENYFLDDSGYSDTLDNVATALAVTELNDPRHIPRDPLGEQRHHMQAAITLLAKPAYRELSTTYPALSAEIKRLSEAWKKLLCEANTFYEQESSGSE